MNDSAGQSRFQVRFDWGSAGARAIGERAHVLVWCDALPTGAGVPDFAGAVLWGSTGNATATARWILELQSRLGDRAMVAVVAAGTDEGGFAVEDLLAAGAVIDALATVGIDFTSPEAAAASAAYAGLRAATLHLTSASVTGQRVSAAELAAARERNTAPAPVLLRGFSETG